MSARELAIIALVFYLQGKLVIFVPNGPRKRTREGRKPPCAKKNGAERLRIGGEIVVDVGEWRGKGGRRRAAMRGGAEAACERGHA